MIDPEIPGATATLEDMRNKWPGHGIDIEEAVFNLIEQGHLKEHSHGYYGRVV